MRERASGKEQVGGRRGERARLEKGKEQGKPLSFYLSPEITLGPSYSYRSLLSSIRDYRNVSSSSTPFPPPENPCRFFPLYFFSFLRFPTNRLADHPFAQTCTIEFNQFFFLCVVSVLFILRQHYRTFLKSAVGCRRFLSFYFFCVFFFFSWLLFVVVDGGGGGDHQLLWSQSNQT